MMLAPHDKLKPLPTGESGKLQVGQRVYAIGNPFGLDQSLTSGLISAGRESSGVAGSNDNSNAACSFAGARCEP